MNRDTVLDEMRILLVEDDDAIAEVVARGLRAKDYFVEVQRDGRLGLEAARRANHGLVVLDLMLPSLNGFDICRELRAAGIRVPILMLTARDSLTDKIRGLELGADDYLAKPFAFEELLARVRALLRRDKVNKGRVVEIAHLKLDTELHAAWVNGRRVDLKPREYLLLEALALNEGRVLSRDTIQDRVWGNEESFSNVVDVHVKRLREKIGGEGLPELIHTYRGIGYSLRRPD